MPEMSQKTWWIVVAILALICVFLGVELLQRGTAIDGLNTQNAALSVEKDQLILDLEKMRFAYDTLETENGMMLAELAAQQDRIDGLLTQVKNGRWELSKAQKEAETLRAIMKGYIATIDSLNQLNLALLDENLAMKEQVEAVAEENAALVQKQENMEEMLEAGRSLQAAEITAVGLRMLSSGRQRDTDRADRTEMIRVCFTLLENRIAPVGKTELVLRLTTESGTLVLGDGTSHGASDGASASRVIDYARERLEACIFCSPSEPLDAGIYSVEVLQDGLVIGSTTLELR
ncbi:MAG: hypothetical protein O2791_02655 [Bacteroidetes bacterium]|jgi:FtsZ-binding cell division protein ZapB|nr:hypothetical protein [Bacteroidota bacterium]